MGLIGTGTVENNSQCLLVLFVSFDEVKLHFRFTSAPEEHKSCPDRCL